MPAEQGLTKAIARLGSGAPSVLRSLDQTSSSAGKQRLFRHLWRTKDEYATLLPVVSRTCTVAVKDVRDVEHSIEVTAETLYEAIATALAALQQDNWVGEICQGSRR
jgi:hypothetical protein